MKVVGIVATDWANAAWKVFNALKTGGVDAKLINLYPRKKGPMKGYISKYDLEYWAHKNECLKAIEEADIYHIFESGGTVERLKDLNLAKRPRILSINSSPYYSNPKLIDKELKSYADLLTCLTINFPHKDVRLGLQPIDTESYCIREDYSLKNGKHVVVGGAPGYIRSYNRKGFPLLKKRIKNIDVLMDSVPEYVLDRMTNHHDVFTHGLDPFGSYGYSMMEAAALGIPCFTHTKERDKDKLLIDGVFPILEIGRKSENLDKVLSMLEEESVRRKWGQLAAKWVRKYHSYSACCSTYSNFYKELLGR